MEYYNKSLCNYKRLEWSESTDFSLMYIFRVNIYFNIYKDVI